MRFNGNLKTWNDERGFGFIEAGHGMQEIFVHIKAFTSRSARPEVGMPLSFEVESNSDGKKRAKNVQSLRASRSVKRNRDKSPAQWGTATYFAIPMFLIVFLVTALIWGVSTWIVGLYFVMSSVCFIAYAIDKSAAKAGGWRISESTLILLGLVGGGPGAIVAQQILRHKSVKAEFRSAFWVSVVMNVIVFVAVNSPFLTRFINERNF